MFFPFGDTPNPPGFRAWVTWLLIAINVLVWAVTAPLGAMPADPADPLFRDYLALLTDQLPQVPVEQLAGAISAYDLLLFRWGYKPGAPEALDLLASMFLHGGVAHLGGNMLFLWIYGDNVEHRVGRGVFLVLYLLTGAAATLGFAALAGPSMTPLVGASGAISGLLGLYFVMFPRNRVKVLVFLFPLLLRVWLVPARVVLGLFVVLDNLLPLLGGAQTGVAYGAHLGGFIGGLVIALAGERVEWRAPWRADREVVSLRALRARLEQETSPAERARLQLQMAEVQLDEGEPVSAYQHLAAVFDETPDAATASRARALLQSLGVDPRLVPR